MEDGEVNEQNSCRRHVVRPKLSPAKENMEPPAPANESEKPVKSKSRSRRKLCANSLHPALDQDDDVSYNQILSHKTNLIFHNCKKKKGLFS